MFSPTPYPQTHSNPYIILPLCLGLGHQNKQYFIYHFREQTNAQFKINRAENRSIPTSKQSPIARKQQKEETKVIVLPPKISIIFSGNIFMQRGKTNTAAENKTGQPQNTFLLRRLAAPSNSPSVQVDFSPPLPKIDASPDCPPPETAPSLPIFMHDSCYFTPSFVIACDQPKYITHADSYLSLHLDKIKELSCEKNELWVPRPSSSNSYCCICKCPFEDYLTHVTLPKHQQLMRTSQFVNSIEGLCGLFSHGRVEQKKQNMKNRSKKTIVKTDKPKRKKGKEMGSPLSTGIQTQFSLLSKAKEIMV